MQAFSLIKTQGYINGEYVDAQSGRTFSVLNPATQQEICQVADLGKTETEQAIVAGEHAPKHWEPNFPQNSGNRFYPKNEQPF
ncbi:aldehyde dehydrogenase family protein [Avibacterium paragallinarum]|uniref:aldehyde dehydrogenase family protein n=1 Tax=Avibacterium paragallinarum TaxID=728 RepID=UPI00034BAF25